MRKNRGKSRSGNTRSSIRSSKGTTVLFVLASLSVISAGVLAWGSYWFVRGEFPNVAVLRTQYPVVRYHPVVKSAGIKTQEPPTVLLSQVRPPGWVGLGEVSRVAVGAVLVSEDWAFYQHKGYDANQIKEAIKEDWEEGRFARGASTITQQVVRNVFLDKDKNLWRKVKELYLAIRLEETTGKRKILESYLNIAEWGEGVFGIHAASRHYFGKHPSQLTAREGAFLAMLLPSPKRYSQSYRAKKLTRYARSTVDSILTKMTQANYISEDQRLAEVSMSLPFERVELPTPEQQGMGDGDSDAEEIRAPRISPQGAM